MAEKEIDIKVFGEVAQYALEYLEESKAEGRYDPAKMMAPCWVGSLCTANGLGAIKFETRSPEAGIRDVLDGLLGFCEIMANISGLQMACVENPSAKRVFIFHPDLISKDSLEKGRYYGYSNLTRESLKDLGVEEIA